MSSTLDFSFCSKMGGIHDLFFVRRWVEWVGSFCFMARCLKLCFKQTARHERQKRSYPFQHRRRDHITCDDHLFSSDTEVKAKGLFVLLGEEKVVKARLCPFINP